MSTLKVSTISPLGTDATKTITVGTSGDTFTVTDGVTVAGASANTPSFQAFKAANQTISASSYVQIQFDTKDYDTDTCYNNTGSSTTLNGLTAPAYSFVPNVAGKYLIGAAINSNTSTDFDAFIVAIFKNGTQINRVINSSKHFDSAVTNFIVTANGTGDYFQIYGYTEQSGGSTLQPTDSDSRLMWFCGQRIIGA